MDSSDDSTRSNTSRDRHAAQSADRDEDSSSKSDDRAAVKRPDEETYHSIEFAQQTTTINQFHTVDTADDESNSIASSSSDDVQQMTSDARRDHATACRESTPPRTTWAAPSQTELAGEPTQQRPASRPKSMPQTSQGGSMATTRVLQQDAGLMKQRRDAVSVHRAWTLERVAEEERRQEAELARQWKELTFRPQLREIHKHRDPIALENSVPCHERLYKSVIHHIPPGYHPPVEQPVLDKPVINETSRRIAARRGTVQERLLARKAPPTSGEQKKKAPDGSAEAADRLSKPIRRKIKCAVEEPTFRPTVTEFASQLHQKKPVVDRLFKPKVASSS